MSDNAAASAGPSVDVPEGQANAEFLIRTQVVPAETPVTITARSGSATATARLDLTIVAAAIVVLCNGRNRFR